jgi:predicted glycosyltransferase
MRVWIDLANSPHVPLLVPVVSALEEDGHEVLLTARDHAQTLELARRHWPAVETFGGPSPGGRLAKGAAIARRADALRRFARSRRPRVAFSHGSYAQLVAARLAGVPAATMMDYEHQPANHLSFRLARKVIVPEVFPASALQRCGARPRKVIRYPGFKEELYLANFRPHGGVLDQLDLDDEKVIAVMRPPPDGALYHRSVNRRFDDLFQLAASRADVQTILLPRTPVQAARYGGHARVRIPHRAVDGSSLLAAADLVIGGGGTMNRESAVLGTPTYTVFAGELAAVDAELIRLGRMSDLRRAGVVPRFEKKPRPSTRDTARAEPIMEAILGTLTELAR